MDLSSMVPIPIPPHFVNSQLVCLSPVGIFNKFLFLFKHFFFVYSGTTIKTTGTQVNCVSLLYIVIMSTKYRNVIKYKVKISLNMFATAIYFHIAFYLRDHL